MKNIESFKKALETLTPFEVEAVKQAWRSSRGNGHDFGYADDIKVPGVKTNGNGGVISSLVKKGILCTDDEFGQICFFSWYDEGSVQQDGGHTAHDKYTAAKIVQEHFNLS